LNVGEVRWGEPTQSDPEALRREQEQQAFEELQQAIEQAIEADPSLRQYREQLLLDITDEGLRIQIIDLEDRPMFQRGSAALQPYAVDILAELAALLDEVGNRISISGHTDAAPFAGGEIGYSNWELSNDRANAARRELITAGLDPNKILRIVGLASTSLLDREDAFSPINRRISIVVVNRDTEQSIVLDEAASED